MATETTRQIIQENPDIEAYRLGLLQSVQQFINENLAQMPPPPVTPPAYQVAGLTPAQQQAAQMVQQGIGGYQPYLQAGLGAMRAGEEVARTSGLGGLQEAFGATREGQAALSQAAELAAQTRAQPYAYQREATNVLRGAQQLGYGAGEAAQKGIGLATQQAYDVAAATRGDIGRSTQQAYDVAAATRGDIGRSTQQAYDIAEQARSDLSQAGEYGLQGAEQAYGYLGGAGGEFTADKIQSFMNPYEAQVVQQTMRDIAREGDIREQGLQAQAASVGAFGGSRQAVAEQELARNVMEQQARTGAQMRMAGYDQAGQMAQNAFEQARQRELARAQTASNIGQSGANIALTAAQTGAQLGLQAAGMGQQGAQTAGQLNLQAAGLGQQTAQQLGQLGLGYGQLGQSDVNQLTNIAQASGQLGQGLSSLAQAGGQLGTQLSQMGLQQAGLGQLQQQLGLQDIKAVEAMGGRDQALQQAILDAQRQTNQQLYQMPYEQYSFLSDIYKGTPSSQMVTQISQQQDPSTFQQIAGLGIAGLSAAGGAKQMMGMF